MALILTIDEFIKHVPVNKSVELEWLNGDLKAVEEEQIKPLLGAAFFDFLTTAHAAGTATDLQAKLIDKLQYALANLAQARFLPIQQLQFSSRGVHILSTEEEKTPFAHQINKAQQRFTLNGYNGLESVLRLLEEHIDHADFAVWANSEAVTVFHRYFLDSSDEFSQFYNIGQARLTYLSLVAIIRKCERFFLEPVLGSALFNEVKDQIMDRELTADNITLLNEYVRPALAHLAVSKAIAEGGFSFSGSTLQVNVLEDTEAGTKAAVMAEKLLLNKQAEAYRDGHAYLVKLKDYLNSTASETKYAAYYTSSLYTAPGSTNNAVYTNPSDTKTFSFI